MDKNNLIENLRAMAEKGMITREEILAVFEPGIPGEPVASRRFFKLNIPVILSYIGGVIIFLGITFLIRQNWITLNSAAKILASLGSGIAFYIAGIMLEKETCFRITGHVFFLVSALLLPLGISVVFLVAGLGGEKYIGRVIMPGILLVTYLLSYRVLRNMLFMIFSICFGTWLFFGIIASLNPGRILHDWGLYALLVAGLSHTFLGYSFSRDGRNILGNFLYGCGICEFLGGALALGGYFPRHYSGFWELVFPFLVFGVIFASVRLKNLVFLSFGFIFLVIYILKIGFEYFSYGGMDLPIFLVTFGAAMILLGTMFHRLKRQYF